MSPMAGEAGWSLRPETDHPTSGGHDDPPIATGAQRPVNDPCSFADGSPIPAFLTAPATGTRLGRGAVKLPAVTDRPYSVTSVYYLDGLTGRRARDTDSTGGAEFCAAPGHAARPTREVGGRSSPTKGRLDRSQ
jgi:hypothetical protein